MIAADLAEAAGCVNKVRPRRAFVLLHQPVAMDGVMKYTEQFLVALIAKEMVIIHKAILSSPWPKVPGPARSLGWVMPFIA
jgi:hypothetical protein